MILEQLNASFDESHLRKETGSVFNIQRFSLDDGPGTRTVVFLKGCPLHCLWCHNPEGIDLRPQLMYLEKKCIGCGACQICPLGLHKMLDGSHSFMRETCSACGQCSEVCPSMALQISGRKMNVEQVMQQVDADRLFYGREGGITLSGGEPLMQPDFAAALLKVSKQKGYSTAVETSACVPKDHLLAVVSDTDWFLFDWKLSDQEMHDRFTGADMSRIKENLDMIYRLGKKIILRCPIIPDVNDNDPHLEGIIGVMKRHPLIVRCDLEPYHSLGIGKSQQLGNPYFKAKNCDPDLLKQMAQRIEQNTGIRTIIK